MSDHPVISAEKRAAIVKDAFARNGTQREIAKRYGVVISTVQRFYSIAKKAGATGPTADLQWGPKRSRSKYAALVPEILKLREQNLSVREIAEKLKIPYTTASYHAYHKTTDSQGETPNGKFDTRFLVGFGCAELERTLNGIAQRLGIAPNLLRQGFSKFLGGSPLR